MDHEFGAWHMFLYRRNIIISLYEIPFTCDMIAVSKGRRVSAYRWFRFSSMRGRQWTECLILWQCTYVDPISLSQYPV